MIKLIKITSLLFIISSNICYAQSINGTPLNELDIEYLEIKTSMSLNPRISVSYDEQGEIFVSNKKPNINSLRDENGNMIVLPTQIAALNFFAKNGFELVEAFAIETPAFRYLILRRKDD